MNECFVIFIVLDCLVYSYLNNEVSILFITWSLFLVGSLCSVKVAVPDTVPLFKNYALELRWPSLWQRTSVTKKITEYRKNFRRRDILTFFLRESSPTPSHQWTNKLLSTSFTEQQQRQQQQQQQPKQQQQRQRPATNLFRRINHQQRPKLFCFDDLSPSLPTY